MTESTEGLLACIACVVMIGGMILLAVYLERKEKRDKQAAADKLKADNEDRLERLGGHIIGDKHYTSEELSAKVEHDRKWKIRYAEIKEEKAAARKLAIAEGGRTINGQFYTAEQIAQAKAQMSEDQFDSFLVSGVVGFVTGSSILGFLAGGSITGALLGDFFEGGDDSFL